MSNGENSPSSPVEVRPAPVAAETAARAARLALPFALVAGLAAWFVGEQLYGVLDPELTLAGSLSGQVAAQQDAADTRTAALLYGALGAGIGLSLGLAGGLARRAFRPALMAGLTGLVLGAAAGSLMSLALVPVHHRSYDPDTQDLLFPLIIHAAIWGLSGLAAGLALAMGLGLRRRAPAAMVGGLAGAAVGAGIYELLGAFAFPLANTAEPMAQSPGARLLACLAVALGAALGAVAGAQPPRASQAAPAPTPPAVA